jgi:hypothetical protein
MTLESIRKHPAYNAYDIPKRILSYPFMHEVFYEHKIKIVIPTDQLQRTDNPLRLTCVFADARNSGEVVLGLRRNSSESYFVPTTLFFSRKVNYTKKRSSKVTFMDWTEK